MQDKLLLFKLIRRWQLETKMKNTYIWGDAKIDLDDFRDLIRQTFDVIKIAKNEHIFKNTYPEANDVIDYRFCLAIRTSRIVAAFRLRLLSSAYSLLCGEKRCENDNQSFSLSFLIRTAALKARSVQSKVGSSKRKKTCIPFGMQVFFE